jgi:hypothetical protein
MYLNREPINHCSECDKVDVFGRNDYVTIFLLGDDLETYFSRKASRSRP